MAFVADWLRDRIARRDDIHWIIMDMSGVNDMDAVALSALERDMETLLERGISFACAGMKGPVRDLVERPVGRNAMAGSCLFCRCRKRLPSLDSIPGSNCGC
ncbi:MAG: hypothetical protein A2X58_04385 [Nitrospirae bacterium GWC2_56_14]|nr:MAG: hypothetical protein A2X58_04385 [Nitrospirae bacterium GWC2_56_14]